MCVKPRLAYSMAVVHHGGSTKPARRSRAGLGCPPAIQIGADRCPAGLTSVSAYDPRTRPYVTRHWRAPAGTSPVKRIVPAGSIDGASDSLPMLLPMLSPDAVSRCSSRCYSRCSSRPPEHPLRWAEIETWTWRRRRRRRRWSAPARRLRARGCDRRPPPPGRRSTASDPRRSRAAPAATRDRRRRRADTAPA